MKPKSRGRWATRFLIHSFTVILAVLFFWLLGFVIDDIRKIQGPVFGEYTGPSLEELKNDYLDKDLLNERDVLKKTIERSKQQIEEREEEKRFVRDSTQNLEQTINQLMELQKLSAQKGIRISDEQQASFTSNLNFFLQNQMRYQELNKEISNYLKKKKEFWEKFAILSEELRLQEEPAQEEYDRLVNKHREDHADRVKRHRTKLALFQLAILLPLLIISVYLIAKKRQSVYFPLFLAIGGASLIKVGQVINWYFPTKYFKYILIAALIVVVAQILIYFIRSIARPKAALLLKQYREAYERFLCPICDYPIRIGPRRFLYWTRRTVNNVIPQKEMDGDEEIYTCPACGTHLFEECSSCKGVRYSLLTHCQHCGAEKQLQL